MAVAPTPTPTHRRRATPPGLLAFGLTLAAAAVVIAFLLVRHSELGSSSSSLTVGSGRAISQARTVAAFSKVELAGSNIVTIRVGRPQAVVVHADDNLVGRVTTTVDGGRLVIGDRGRGFSVRSPMSVAVTTPSLDALILSGSGAVDVSGVDTPRLAVSLPGSGAVRAAGSAGTLDVVITGSGTADLRGLRARDVRAGVSGSGVVNLTATHALNAQISGSGAINYGGNPKNVLTLVTGNGAITPLP